ncbi:insulinase family protein [Pseudoalteromonas tunicata]|uniref:insulinase family protein n=1 Tax=Pseudoalteromonas tunicata TaxID=314281 RepID=UPI00273F8203|nr:insulinase family protein [Pseudoalteromonas tunicata]MDP5213931.1 insulinase family protein [Pseudoalteromonas tunicata]
MKKVLAFSAIALAVLAGCTATPSSTSSASLVPDSLVVSPNDKRAYKTLKLNNEIEVVLVSDPSVEKSAAALSVGVGLLHDPMTQQGMAHYLEHMLFLGTERYPDTKEYSEFMTKNGGAHNAYTWLDITNYMFKVNNDAYDNALDRFADFFKAPKLYPEYTDKEKNAVNAEWSMRREMDFFGQFKLSRILMGEHPANRFLIGNLETLGDKENSNLHKETVDFYNKYYSSNIMKVAMISNLPLSEMEALATKYFSDIKNKNIAKPEVTQSLDLTKVAGKKVYYKPNEDVKQLKLDFTIKNNITDYAVKPNSFISYLLSSEMPGTPAQILRDKGWVSQLTSSASPDMYGNYGSLSIDAELTDLGMQHRDEIVAIIMQYIDLIKKEGVNDKYFNEIRTSLNNQFQFLEKGDEFGYVSNLADSMQKYPLNNVINAGFYYAKFDKNSVNAVLEQLTPAALKVWYISQQEQTDSKLHFYDGEYRLADFTAQEIAAWQQPTQVALTLPAVNRLLPENFAIKTNADTATEPKLVLDEAGIKIWQVASTNFGHQPKGLLKVYINSELAERDAKAQVLYSVWADLYNLQQSALSTEASIAGMNLGVAAANGLTFTLNGFTDKQALLLEQGLKTLQVAVDEQGFAQAIDRFSRDIANEGKQFPYYQAFGEFSKVISNGSYSNDALLNAAKSLTAADLNAFMAQTLQQNQIRSFVFGNYDQNDINHIAAQLKAIMPSDHKTTAYSRDKTWLPKAGEVYVMKKDIDVADVAIVDVVVHPEPGYKQKARASILQNHFRTVAFDKLRTEEQLAYAVGGFARPVDEFASLGLFIQTPVKGPKEMQARFDAFKKEYVSELNKVTEETFQQLKNSTLVGLKEQPKNLSDELSPLLGDWYRENFAFDSRAKLIAEVEKVTLADIKAFYAQTMGNTNAARINIQLRGTKFKDTDFAAIAGEINIKDLADAKSKMQYQ